MLLTIAIPTYNRNETLSNNLGFLLLQNDIHNVEIIILDNASVIPVAENIGHLIPQYPNLKIIRNCFNVGMSGNFLKCLEHSNGEWIWVLGDDDRPMEDCITNILTIIRLHNDYLYINFKSNLAVNRLNNYSTLGIEEFVQNLDSFSNLLFFTSGIYNKRIKENLRIAYLYSYSLAPHIAILMISMNINSKVFFSNQEIVFRSNENNKSGKSWSMLSLSMALGTLSDLPLKISNNGYKLWLKMINSHILDPKTGFISILPLIDRENFQYMKRFFQQVYFRSKSPAFEVKRIFYFCFCSLFFINYFSMSLFRSTYKVVKKKTYTDLSSNDLLNRL